MEDREDIGGPRQKIPFRMVIRSKNREMMGFSNSMGVFANGIWEPWHFDIRIQDGFQCKFGNLVILTVVVKA
jgi:hypothetical protein